MVVRSPFPAVAIPDVPLTPFLMERAGRLGDKPAIIDASTGRTLTYRAWCDSVRRAAAGLAARGFRKGDVFAIYSANTPEYAIAFHAVSLLGGIVTTINPQYTAAELSRQLADARARRIATMRMCLDNARQAARENDIDDVYVFGDTFDALLEQDGAPASAGTVLQDDVVALPYSSGTTGLPKGVMLTHRNIVSNILQCSAVFDLRENDVTLGVLPFFHIYGLVVIMNLTFYAGGTIVIMPKFDLQECLKAIATYRVTYAYVVPPIMLALAKSPIVEQYDLSSVRTLFSGAAPLSAQVAQTASQRLRCTITQGYGMTEASPATHCARPGASGIGPPLPNTDSKIVDVASGAELGPGQEGEICVRGPQVMKGYLNNPSATAAMIDAEGWLHTGDIGSVDGGGCFHVVDRVKELIKYKGMQIAPAELEAVLLGHPCIADAAVVPIADEEAGQVPKAFVVLKQQSTADDIMTYVADRVARYKRVRRVEMIDQIPRSPSGKILRRVLMDRERR